LRLFKRKLTLREIHQLYLTLKDCLPEKEEKYLVDEIIKILKKITPDELRKVMELYYKKRFNFDENPGKIANMFIRLVKESDLFSYVYFIKSIK
jgi:hypothetical protein